MLKSLPSSAKGFGIAVLAVGFVAGCAVNPFAKPDPRWADYKNWKQVTAEQPSTGNAGGLVATVHAGTDGFREVYVNDVGADAMLGGAPYNFPAGTVIVKEQYANKADWEAGKGAQHTISVKVEQTENVSAANWIWSAGLTKKAGASDFCQGCHTAATATDFVFSNPEFLAKHAAQ